MRLHNKCFMLEYINKIKGFYEENTFDFILIEVYCLEVALGAMAINDAREWFGNVFRAAGKSLF